MTAEQALASTLKDNLYNGTGSTIQIVLGYLTTLYQMYVKT
jgi:hypothetical protein